MAHGQQRVIRLLGEPQHVRVLIERTGMSDRTSPFYPAGGCRARPATRQPAPKSLMRQVLPKRSRVTHPVTVPYYNRGMPGWEFAVLGALLGGAVVALVLIVRQSRLTADVARLGAELRATARASEEQRALLAASQTQVRDTFAALSKDALRENRTDFLQNADALLQPMRDTLDRVRAQMVDVDKAREGSFQAVTSELRSLARAQEQLRTTTDELSRSLRSPNVRGRWGEIQLKRIVELAGMLEQCDFIEKPPALTAEGARQQPDLVVRLPGEATLVVDAKVPIDAYLSATSARNETERQDFLAAHARQVRDHV